MVRTQIYLAEDQHKKIIEIAVQKGEKQSKVIRDAISLYLKKNKPLEKKSLLSTAKGMWKGRKDLPGFEELRKEWDR